MSDKTLNICHFAECIRTSMNKKSLIKDFDINKEIIEDLSKINRFYFHLLKSITYNTQDDNVPDIDATMASQLKNGKNEVHPKIKEIAQKDATRKNVIEYFEINIIPNIPKKSLSVVLDRVNALVQSDSGLGPKKQRNLKELRNSSGNGASYLADVWLLAVCEGKNKEIDKKIKSIKDFKSDSEMSSELTVESVVKNYSDALNRVDDILKKIPKPISIQPTDNIQEHEMPYISALYDVYKELLGISFCDEKVLKERKPECEKELKEHRIYYYAAHSVERGLREFQNSDNQHFEALKDDVYEGVKFTARKNFKNGYERLNNVMEKAGSINAENYILSDIKFWISIQIKRGACHYLVNDGKLIWVKN